MSWAERIGQIADRIPHKKWVALGTGTISVLYAAGRFLTSGVPQTGEEERAKGVEQGTETPAGLVIEPTSTIQPAESGPRLWTGTFRGVTYSTVPSKDFPVGCATVYVSRLMTPEQLKQAGIKRGDRIYMKRGQGLGNSHLLWGCGLDGKRHFNQPYLPKPGPKSGY